MRRKLKGELEQWKARNEAAAASQQKPKTKEERKPESKQENKGEATAAASAVSGSITT